MKLHPRHEPMVKAERELAEFVTEWRWRHGLTLAEELSLVTEHLARSLCGVVRGEREGGATDDAGAEG